MFCVTRRPGAGQALMSFVFVVICFLLASGASGLHIGVRTPLAGSSFRGQNISQALINYDEKSTFHEGARLVERLDAASYAIVVNKGAQLDCLFSKSLAGVISRTGSSIEVTGYMLESLFELEGWQTVASTTGGAPLPLFQNYLDTAFQALGISKGTGDPGSATSSIYMANWANTLSVEAPVDLDNSDDFYQVQPTQAKFCNDFIPASGVIIADTNLNPANAMIQNLLQYSTNEISHIQRWSDAAFMSWSDACRFKNGNIQNVQYIFRSWIRNSNTLDAVFQAIQNYWTRAAMAGSPTIGTWGSGRITFTAVENPEEFHAVLGSPNGAGSAYFLLTHKTTLGVKRISKVDIFTPNVAYTLPTSLDSSSMPASVKIMLLFYVEPVANPVDT